MLTRRSATYNAVGARISLINLLNNYACRVGLRGESRLYCTCNGIVMTVFWGVAAVVCLLAMINFAVLMGIGENVGADIRKGTVGAICSVLMAITFAHLVIQRYASHGRFELDAEHLVMKRYRGNRLVGEFHFRDVRRVWTTFDFTDGVRLSGPPKWLQIAMNTGEIFRIAKGDTQELRPVCDAIRRMGLSLG